jgi:hypothetical protein
MRRSLTLVLLANLFTFCREEAIESPPNTKNLKRSLLDTLIQFSSLQKGEKRDDSSRYVLYSNDLNNHRIGLIAITDSMFFLFQKMDEKWVQTDSALFDSYAFAFDISDLNGDNQEDFIMYRFPNAHGQSRPCVFISDNKGILHYRPDIQLFNMHYDKKTKLMRSFYTGGLGSPHCKELYKWVRDSLVLLKGVEHHFLSEDKKDRTVFYSLQNGKRFDTKEVIDNEEAVYDTALWTGY